MIVIDGKKCNSSISEIVYNANLTGETVRIDNPIELYKDKNVIFFIKKINQYVKQGASLGESGNYRHPKLMLRLILLKFSWRSYSK